MKKNLFVVATLAFASLTVSAIDLSTADKAVADYKAKLADPKARAYDKAVAKIRLLNLEAMTGTEKDLVRKRAELEDYLTKPIEGLKPYDQFDFIKNLYRERLEVRLPDAYTLAERFVKNLGADGKALEWTLFSYRLETMRRSDSLDEAKSAETRLKLVDEALAKPENKNHELWLQQRHFEALGDLARDAEAEVYALKVLATTNRQVRSTFHPILAEFYEGRSVRYCSKPDAATLLKAVHQYREYLTIVGKDPSSAQRTLHKIASCLKRAGDPEGARKALDEEEAEIAKLPEARRKAPVQDIAMMRGDLCFEAKDYTGALGFWEPYGETIRKTGGAYEVTRLLRMCSALSAAGRRADMLPYLEVLAKRGNKYTKLRYQYDLQNLKSQLAEPQAQ